MFADTMSRVIADAHPSKLDHLSRLLWQGHASGAIHDEAAQSLAEALQARREASQAKASPSTAPAFKGQPTAFLRPPRQQSPDRRRSIERRRRWAACGLLPPQIACRLTLGEQAVLAVVAAENRKRGDCRITNGAIAGAAGVSVSTVKNALRAARTLGIITIEERRVSAFRNAANIVRITDAAWRCWLKLGGGGRKVTSAPTTGLKTERLAVKREAAKGLSNGRAGRFHGLSAILG